MLLFSEILKHMLITAIFIYLVLIVFFPPLSGVLTSSDPLDPVTRH